MLKMGLKKTHEHESGFFEENLLTASESNKNRFKLAAEEKMRSTQPMRSQANLIDSCNNVSQTYGKVINPMSNYQYQNTQTIVIDSDGEDSSDNRYLDDVVVSTVTNGHCSSNPDPDVVDIADDSDDPDEMLESIQVSIHDNTIDDSADEDVDIDGSMQQHHHHYQQPQPQQKNEHTSSQQSKSSNTSSNNNRLQEKTKNGDTDAKSSIQLMQEIEEASTIRPQGE